MGQNDKHVEWLGRTQCDFCGVDLATVQNGDFPVHLYDFRTKNGPWGVGCSRDYARHRASFHVGEGHAQIYTRQPDGKFIKTGG